LKAARAKVLRLCCLTSELSGRQRQAALDSKRKMGRRPSAWWPAWPAVGAPLERVVRQHRFVVGLEAQKFVAHGLKNRLRDGGMLAEVIQLLF